MQLQTAKENNQRLRTAFQGGSLSIIGTIFTPIWCASASGTFFSEPFLREHPRSPKSKWPISSRLTHGFEPAVRRLLVCNGDALQIETASGITESINTLTLLGNPKADAKGAVQGIGHRLDGGPLHRFDCAAHASSTRQTGVASARSSSFSSTDTNSGKTLVLTVDPDAVSAGAQRLPYLEDDGLLSPAVGEHEVPRPTTAGSLRARQGRL